MIIIKLCVYFIKLNKLTVLEANNTLIELICSLCFLIKLKICFFKKHEFQRKQWLSWTRNEEQVIWIELELMFSMKKLLNWNW